MADLAHRYTIFVRTTPAELWPKLVEAEHSQRYFLGAAVASSLVVGEALRYIAANAEQEDEQVEAISGTIREVVPSQTLAHSFRFADLDAPETQVRWSLSQPNPEVPVTQIDLVHDGFSSATETYARTGSGWPRILSGLKTYVETGEPLELDGLSSE